MHIKTPWVALAMAAVCIASVGAPFIIPEPAPLNTGATLLSAFASLVTMMLAFSLHRRFGVEQRMLDRQFDAITKLLEDMTNVWFAFLAPRDPKIPQLSTRVRIYAIMPSAKHDTFPEADLPIFITNELMTRCNQLARHSANVFLPLAIAEPLGKLNLGWIDGSRIDPEPAHLRLCDEDRKINPSDFPLGFKVRGEFMLTPNKLEAMLRAVIDAINEWHRQHAGSERKLNIPSNRCHEPV